MISRHGGLGVRLTTDAALCGAFAFVAAASVVSLFLADKRVVLSIIGAILFVICFVLSGNQRLFCLWGVVFTAPLALQKGFWLAPHMGGASTLGIEMVDVFIALLLGFELRDLIFGYRHKLRFSPVAFWWGAMILLGLADIIAGPMRHVSTLEVVRMVKCYLLFFVLINELVRVRLFLHAFAALTASVALQAVVGIIQYLFKANLHLQVLGEADPEITKAASESAYNIAGSAGVFRIGGLLGHPNVLSAFMALLLPVCIAMLFARISALRKLIVGVVITAGLVALVLTLSRSGWIAFGVASSFLFAASFLHPRLAGRYLMARLIVLACVIIGLAAFSGTIIKRFTESDPGALNFRYDLIEAAMKMFEDKPVFGFGVNTFVFNLSGYSRYGGPKGLTATFGNNWPVVHSTWLVTLVEQGAVGFFFFVGLHIYILWLGFKNARIFIDDRLFTMQLGCIGGVLAIMVDGLASFFLRWPAAARDFWIVVAIIVAIDYWNRANRPEAVTARATPAVPPIPAETAA